MANFKLKKLKGNAAAVVPSAPVIGTATAGSGQATVTFSPSAFDGGAAIDHYRVTSTPGSITSDGATSPIIITGLTNDTAYTFKVKGHNSVGYGNESAASNSVTPTDDADFPGAPASVHSPVVGTSRMEQWNLQKEDATGPGSTFANGAWDAVAEQAHQPVGTRYYPARPANAYLLSTGCYYNNYEDLWWPTKWLGDIDVVLEGFDFDGAPRLSVWGNGISVLVDGCANFSLSVSEGVNRNPDVTDVITWQMKNCDFDGDLTVWGITCICDFELGPYNRIRNQTNVLGFGGGYAITQKIGINCHHNFITGGGVNSSAHIEWWQHIFATSGTGSYMKLNDNMVDFTQDGQPQGDGGWTGVVSEGGDCALEVKRNIFKGLDVVAAYSAPGIPIARMGPIVAYGDANVTAGFTFEDNACSCSPYSPGGYTYKHGGGSLKPSVSGNRTFRDSASDGISGGPADNTALTLADFN